MSENKFSKLKNIAVDVLFPPRCPFCKSVIPREMLMCDRCREALPGADYSRHAMGGAPCAVALPYIAPYAAAMKSYKFGKKSDYARAFAYLTVNAIRRLYGEQTFDAVTCVPMSKKSSRKRGFHHAETLAAHIAGLLDVPYLELLEKYKENLPQHFLKRSDRENNVKGVYRAKNKALCRGKNVLLIDDILTTGYTIGECVRVLRRAGCKSVCCAVTCTAIV